jgi:L-threonylcarbamoyladenylate synthase
MKFDNEPFDASRIRFAADVLRKGGLVAFPTETVYGLGADAMNVNAVEKVFKAKGRPSDNPLIVHIAGIENIGIYTDTLPEKGLKLAKIFWPGPLTLILKKNKEVPDIVSANLNTIALRVPNHLVTLEMLKCFGGGIVGPSANISGRPSPTTAEHVYQDLNGKIDVIIDAGPTNIGIESTVIDVTVDPPVILRMGGLSTEDIEKEIGKVDRTEEQDLLNRSPGTRHRHYSPKARVVLFPEGDIKKFRNLVEEGKSSKIKFGAITYSQALKDTENGPSHITIGPEAVLYAKNIFRALRELDGKSLDVIYVESVKEEGIGAAIMDRLRKASA